jgi:hypothetical protein
MMNTCATCGNSYERCLQITRDGDSRWFDCFECAITALAPRCAQCSTLIIGHGVQVRDTYYCCANCATLQGNLQLKDHA